jgi:hypothetical protein
MFGIGLFVGLTFGIIIGLCIYAWVESPRKIKVGTPSTSNNSQSVPSFLNGFDPENKGYNGFGV